MKNRYRTSILIFSFATIFIVTSFYMTSNYVSGTMTIDEMNIERTHDGYYLLIDNREFPLSHHYYKQLINDETLQYEFTYKYNIFSGKRGKLVKLTAVRDTDR